MEGEKSNHFISELFGKVVHDNSGFKKLHSAKIKSLISIPKRMLNPIQQR